ncbi:MAG: glycosyl transferase family 1 [Mesorhizobium amorphae]|nr:MAG: glycosyl transferase family 1 [Mesorhizobium amorphae]
MIFLGAASFAAGRGGIARVARLSGLTLAAAGRPMRAVSLLDHEPHDLPFAVRHAKGSKLRFCFHAWRGTRGVHLSLYDSAGVARAHPRGAGPFAVWMHGIEAWENAKPQALAVFRRAARVLVNSQHTLARFERLHGALPTARVCPLATEADSAALPPLANPPTALILGRIDERESYKGHEHLIDAWPAVVASVPEARLLMAGGGRGLPAIQARAARSPVAHRIDVRGFVPESAIEELWRETGLLAMPSRGEGFGLVYAEAMRRGIPVLASVHDAGSEVNRHGETGFCIDHDQPGELARSLIELLRDEALRTRMGRAGQARWQAEFRFTRFRRRFASALFE